MTEEKDVFLFRFRATLPWEGERVFFVFFVLFVLFVPIVCLLANSLDVDISKLGIRKEEFYALLVVFVPIVCFFVPLT